MTTGVKRYLLFLAACILLVIATGAAVTDKHPEFTPLHRNAGIVLGILMLGLMRGGPLGWIAIAVTALEFIPAGPVFHACLAPVLLAIVALMLTETMLTETMQPEVAPVPAVPGKLVWVAMAAPPLVLMQIAFGAAYRHKVWNVIPHLAGATAVTFLLMLLCMVLLQQRPDIRRAATATLVVVLIQVSLGIASLTLRLLGLESSLWFTIATVAHVTTGALTLAATVSLGRLVVGNPAAHGENAGPEQQ